MAEAKKNKETTAKEITEVRSFARGVHISPRKVRLVADTIRNLTVSDALTQLSFQNKKAIIPLKKLVHSAVANASHNFQIESDRLFIKSLTIDGGRVFFRYTPRAQGRSSPIRKRTSHINLTLGVSSKPIQTKTKARVIGSVEKKEEFAEKSPMPEAQVPKPAEKTSSRFAFWRRKKKSEDTTQVPPKQDSKGKHYTGFDRRGNM